MKSKRPRYLGTSPLEQSTIDSITQLRDGRSLTLTFSGDSDTTIRTYRNKIYAYLNKVGIKQYFRLYLEGENKIPNILRIKRLGQQFKTTFLGSSDEDRVSSWVIENLDDFNDIKDSDKVMSTINKAVKQSLLFDSDVWKAYKSWEEIILGSDEVSAKIPTTKFEDKLKTLEQSLTTTQPVGKPTKKGEPKP